MLYECWRRVARERAREPALLDLATRRQWSFAELARAAEGAPEPEGPVVYPQGNSAEFVLAILCAWRWRRVVCPLEPGQSPPSVPLPPASCVHLKLTSATTGIPRVIGFTGAQLVADAENIMTTMGLRPDWPNLGAISMAHSYGFSNLVLPLLCYGIPLMIAPAPLPEALRQAAAGIPSVTLPGVPALWRTWHEASAIPVGVRLAISAGAPLPVSVEQEVFARSGVKIHNFYGSSECGGIAYDRSTEPRRDDACVGTPMDNVRLSLADNGCLRVHSRAAGETYWPEPDETLGDGCFQTGDLAELKEELVFLRGRSSDQINVAGRKVSPAAVEQVLRQHAAVRECLVFGVPSNEAQRADMIVACVASASVTQAEELRQFLLSRLPAWQVPRQWWFVDSLSANSRGKISRDVWRRRFLDGQRGRV